MGEKPNHLRTLVLLLLLELSRKEGGRGEVGGRGMVETKHLLALYGMLVHQLTLFSLLNLSYGV